MLRVSENRRDLVHTDGSQFFFLTDAGWTLLHRLGRDDTIRYLDDRAGKGFSVIQVLRMTEFNGPSVPNAVGDLPFHEADPDRLNDTFSRHVDWVVDPAAEQGLHLALLPTWGDKSKLSGETAAASRYDPRLGEIAPVGMYAAAGTTAFAPPTSGPKDDWILMLDDAARGFSAPGSPAA